MARLLNGFFMSLSMFSIFPSPQRWDDKAFPLVMPCLPLVGLLIGGVWYGFAFLTALLPIPLLLHAVLLFLIPLFLSGFIHIDGYMDTSDSIFSRADLQKKRAILKDSHVGAFAVIAFGVYLLLGVSAIWGVLEKGGSLLPLLLLPVVSRSVSGLALLRAKPMSETGFGASFRKNSKTIHLVTISIYLLLSAIAGLFIGWIPLLAAAVGSLLAALFSVSQLQGISGDLCGFIITIGELCGLIALAITG